jgi:hypothetical protein
VRAEWLPCGLYQRLAAKDVLYYNNRKIEIKSSFIYLGILLTTQLSNKAHFERLYRKAIGATNGLQVKANLSKTAYNTAFRLYHAVVIPAGTYGATVFSTVTTEEEWTIHVKRIAGYFWKKWAKTSIYCSTTRLLNGIFEEDHLGLKKAKPEARRIYAWYYANGCHQMICTKQGCYRIAEHEMCKCRICGDNIDNYNHLETCRAFTDEAELKTKLNRLIAPRPVLETDWNPP